MNEKKKWPVFAITLALLLAAIVLPLYAYKVFLKTDYTDFDVYYLAATRVKAQDWAHIYNLGDGASPFRYAPVILPLFRPFAEFSHLFARMTWYFLQYLWFGLGFFFLYRTLRIALRGDRKTEALGFTALSFLFILRFCLDTFTIGQVSSLLFLGLTGGLYFWMIGQPFWAGSFIFLPALFKIGPGFLYALFLSARKKDRYRAWLMPVAWLSGLFGVIALWGIFHGLQPGRLWMNWITIVTQDSSYFDASHYGNQSIKGAILRLARAGWLSPGQASLLFLSLLLLGCTGVILFWLSRRPRTPHGRGLFFSLGLFPYLWFMPETFKYSMTVLAIPAAFLLSASSVSPTHRRSRFTLFSLVFGFLTLSIPGKDVVGDPIFFGLQRASVPLLTTFFLCVAVLRQAWTQSIPSRLGWILDGLFFQKGIGPWEKPVPPPSDQKQGISILIPLPLDSQQPLAPELLKKTLAELTVFFRQREANTSEGGIEILVSPYGNRISRFHPCWREVEELSETSPELRILPCSPDAALNTTYGKGSALRQAFLHSTGNTLLFFNPENPCDPVFYEKALELLTQGTDPGTQLVRGNRRLPTTRFRIPVRTLSRVYGRHRLGLLFNRWVRWKLPITTTDTHSGALVLSRKLATQVFSHQSRGDFLFELELALVAQAQGAKETDLPIRLLLSNEKTPTRMLYETLTIFFGLPKLARRFKKGFYHPTPSQSSRNWLITADDWGLSPGVNQGILTLAEAGVVRRTSALAESAYLKEGLSELQKVPGFEIGIHFNLTHEKSTPGRVLLRALGRSRHVFLEEVRVEFEKQLALLQAAGIHPTYLDGHHHIHLVPGVMEALAKPLQAAGIRQVRLPLDRTLWLSGKFPLQLLALLAAAKLKKFDFQSLPCFYPGSRLFADPSLLRASLIHYTREAPTEVIVHPAALDDFARLQIPDSYTDGRVLEFKALQMLKGILR